MTDGIRKNWFIRKCPVCNNKDIEWDDSCYLCMECGSYFKFDGKVVGQDKRI